MDEYNQDYLERKRRAVERGRGHDTQGSPVHDRLPPGQSLTRKFPILDLGIKPAWDPATWTLEVTGLVKHPGRWSWEDFQKLPHMEEVVDFHCVTRWSKFDVRWGGVRFQTIVDLVRPELEAHFVVQRSADGYSTNLSLEEMLKEDVILADELEGKPLPLDHGGPVRLIVPRLYAWKGAKFVRQLEFNSSDQPGFWENRGYHNHGDPWKEERFAQGWWT